MIASAVLIVQIDKIDESAQFVARSCSALRAAHGRILTQVNNIFFIKKANCYRYDATYSGANPSRWRSSKKKK